MRTGQKEYFLDRLKAVSPSLPQRYREEFGDRYLCNSPRKREALALLRKLCKEAGLLYRMPDIIDAYKKREPNQMGLF